MKNILLALLLLSALFSCNAIVCNFTFEENVPNYPERLINTIATDKRIYSKFLNNKSSRHKSRAFDCVDDDDDDDGFIRYVPSLLSSVSSRFGSSAKEANPFNDSSEINDTTEPLCDSLKSTIFPKTLNNLSNKMVIVVNHGKLRQEVTIERCSNANQPCKFDINFPINVITKCKQKFQTHTMKILNENDQTIIDESVYIPSGCECQFKYKKR